MYKRQVRFLGHGHIISGIVQHGDCRGRTLGLPTANLALDASLLVPAFGVYGGWAGAGELGRFPAAVNLGVHPVSYTHLIDPVGACVGTRGARVGAVVDELHGEKMDIIVWSEDPAKFVAAALSPADVVSVTVLPGTQKACRVIVPDDQLSLAIGKEGQNARLAARLTGYKIDIKPASQAAEFEAQQEAPEEPAMEAETEPEAAEETEE